MELAKRDQHNPVLRPTDIIPSREGMKIECLLNPGVFRFENKTWLLLRVAERPEQKENEISFPVLKDGNIEIMHFSQDNPDLDTTDPRIIRYKGKDYLTTLSHLRLVCSDDGVHFSEPEGYAPIYGEGQQESFGIEDCRVATMEDGYHLSYTKVAPEGVGVGYIFTRNWKDFERRGMIFPPHNKDCAIFEEKINGWYYALHRPSSPELGGNYIWIARSPDLKHWGNHMCIATTRENHWDSARVGAGAAPVRTSGGWLEIYHGATHNHRYCLGALLLDNNDPSKVIARSEQPIMEPTASYEKTGFFGNVIFTNGQLINGDTLTIYYGASDEVICRAEFTISEILSSFKR
ncbi:MAG: glycoside hydrolase family 130 protein [Bacteroidales bacterium]|nr:glycoside hydrolase family 130 protein [Bacteroidales bacterium]MBN2762814.1 glycoside hydrolase family 130 protein [Bacteroidales bacterium]